MVYAIDVQWQRPCVPIRYDAATSVRCIVCDSSPLIAVQVLRWVHRCSVLDLSIANVDRLDRETVAACAPKSIQDVLMPYSRQAAHGVCLIRYEGRVWQERVGVGPGGEAQVMGRGRRL